MDMQHLIDRLEQVLNESSRLPLSANLLVNEDRVFNLIDQMRVAIPEEVKRANRIESEKDRILAQAKEEAERIRGLAKQEASELVKRDAIVASAQQRADNILERARREARRSQGRRVASQTTARRAANRLHPVPGIARTGRRRFRKADQRLDRLA